MEDEKQEKGFVIKDRRRFDDSGEAKPESPREEAAKPQERNRTRRRRTPVKTERRKRPRRNNRSRAQLRHLRLLARHVGHVPLRRFPRPRHKKGERNLEAAKQTIDILGILKEKTKGNLNDDEERLLESLLYELRMRYVRETAK